MLVQDLMTKEVFTLRVDKQLFIAQQIMDWAHIRHIPVVDGQQRLAGLVSHRDLLRASISSEASKVATIERRQHLAGIHVRDVMQADVICVGPLASGGDAARLMQKYKVGCLPVVDEERRLLGIVTTHDLLSLIN